MSARRSKPRMFIVDALEARRLLSDVAYVQIGSSLQSSEFTPTDPIQVLPGQPVTFDVQVTGYQIGGAPGPAPTGSVNIFETNQAGTVDQFATVNLSGGTTTAGGTVATAQGTLALAYPMNIGTGYQAFVYADYQGDANYNDTLSTGQSIEDGGNVVNVNFPAMQYVFMQQPTNVSTNAPIIPPVTVAYEGPGGVDSYFNGPITIGTATGPTGGKIAQPSNSSSGEAYSSNGYLTATAASGVATFPDVEFVTAGTYTLTTANPTVDTAGVSSSFVVGNSNLLAFEQGPTNGSVNQPLNPAVTVKLEDPTKNVITSDNTTLITLTPVGYTGNSPVTGNTATVVAGVASFPNLVFPQKGSYTLQATDAAGDTPATSGKFGISGGTLTLTINSRNSHKTTGVETGDVVFYDLNVTSKKAIQSSVITETLPAGFTPLNISAGGTFANNVITWNTTTHDVSFDYVVPGASVLANLKAIVTTAHADTTYTDSTTDDADATDTVKIAGSLKLTGALRDAQFEFPAKLSVATPALGKVTVELIDPSDGTVIDQKTTAGNGTFTVTANQAGTYQLVFDVLVPTYSSASNGVSTSHAFVGMPVTIPPGNTKPIKLGDLYLPKTFFTTASKVLNALNNYTTSGFQGLQAFKIDLLQFDTSQPESVVNALLGSASNPTPLMNVKSLSIGGPTDPWVAAMRSIAACASIDSRFMDTFKLADQAGKAVAVLASAAVARGLGKSLFLANQDATLGNSISNTLGAGFRLASVSNIDAKLAGAARVAGFTAMGAILPPLLDALGVSATNKGAILGVLFNVLRYGSDLMTGNLLSDLGFEAVFNLSRIATDAVVLEVLTGVQLRPDLPYPYSVVSAEIAALSGSSATGASFQSAITLTGGLVYNTGTDTPQVLSALDKYDLSQHKLVTVAQATTAPINSFASLINGMNGVLQLQSAAGRLGGYPLTKYQFYLQKTLTQAQSALDSVVGKVGSTAAKAGNQLAFAALAVAGAGVVSQALAVTFIPNLAANSVLFGTSTMQASLPPLVPANTLMGERPNRVAPTDIITAAASASPTDVTAYLADLTSMSSLVKKNDTSDIPALYTTLTTDDQALFANDLEPLDAQASTAFSQVPAAKRSVLESFDAELNEAEEATLLANLQLSTWAAAPATGSAAAVVTQFARATAAVKAAAAGAAAVRAQLAGKTLPATLIITETSVPPSAAVGTTQTLTLNITNIGIESTAAGTVSFSNDDGGLTIQGPAEQSLPALSPGTSTAISFSVLVSTPANGDTAAAYQITALAGNVTAELTDTVLLG